MPDLEMVSLQCPQCQCEIYQSLDWFKIGGNLCPGCQTALSPQEFSEIIRALEEAMEESCRVMVNGEHSCGCCGGKGHC